MTTPFGHAAQGVVIFCPLSKNVDADRAQAGNDETG